MGTQSVERVSSLGHIGLCVSILNGLYNATIDVRAVRICININEK